MVKILNVSAIFQKKDTKLNHFWHRQSQKMLPTFLGNGGSNYMTISIFDLFGNFKLSI